MKVKIIRPFYDEEPNKWFLVGEEYNIKNSDINENSDFYHIWNGSKLWIVPKDNCKII